jgi:peptidyl-prolyl cis-trans isomerase SurA
VITAVPLLALLAAAPAVSPQAPNPQIVDRVAALVNGEVVTLSELQERAGPELQRVAAMPPGPVQDAARVEALRQVFDMVVAEKLLQTKAVELQIESTDAQIDAAVADIKQRNGFDDEQLDAALETQGLDRTTFRASVKREYDAFLVLQYQVRGRVKITDEDLKNYYQSHAQEFRGEEEVKVRHIFLPLPQGASAADEAKVRAEAAKLRQRLLSGEDFAKLAREVSKGPSSADGGDLGWLRRGTIEKTLEDAAFALKDGELSQPVRGGPGIHLFKVDERRSAGGKSFEDAKEEIRAKLFEQQAGTFREQMISELKRDALIETKLPELVAAK